MTNYEWLLNMGGEERQAWFDAQHVDDNDALTRKSGVRADDTCANDTCDALKLMREFCVKDILDALGIDCREKNHTRKMVQALADMIERDYVRRDAEERVYANDTNVAQDSREKLEADVRKRYTHTVSTAMWPPSANKHTDMVSVSIDTVLGWLDRQAAITRRGCEHDREALDYYSDRYAEMDEQMVELTERVGELTAECDALKAECDALADDLRDCNREREEYRELFSESLTLAAEIVNLQP